MDEKMNAALKGIYDSLTDEQKEKAKKCETLDELTAFAAKEGVELPNEVLDQVAGGYPIFSNPYCPYCKDYTGHGLSQTKTITPAGESGGVSVTVFRCPHKNREYYYSEVRDKYYDDNCQPMPGPSSSGGGC